MAVQGERNGSIQEPWGQTRELSDYFYVSKEGREKRLERFQGFWARRVEELSSSGRKGSGLVEEGGR